MLEDTRSEDNPHQSYGHRKLCDGTKEHKEKELM